MGTVDELYQDFDISRPNVGGEKNETGDPPETGNRPARPGAQAQLNTDKLVAHLNELETILEEIERLKRTARSSYEWRVVMMYIAGQKPRVSQMRAEAKAIYAVEFGSSFDNQLNPGDEPNGRGTAVKTAEIRAKRDSELALRAVERFDQTWEDLEHLMWACKAVADSCDADERNPTFDAHPDHMFKRAGDAA